MLYARIISDCRTTDGKTARAASMLVRGRVLPALITSTDDWAFFMETTSNDSGAGVCEAAVRTMAMAAAARIRRFIGFLAVAYCRRTWDTLSGIAAADRQPFAGTAGAADPA